MPDPAAPLDSPSGTGAAREAVAPPRRSAVGRLLSRLLGPSPEPADWNKAIAHGEGEGLFGPGSAVWAVNGANSTMVAGIRALLLQTLHPGAMAGVHDWSRYREDTMGRLDNTVRWVLTTTFGDREAAVSVSRWVGGMHRKVVGEYEDARGAVQPYAAADPRLLTWVHVAFTEAFLGAHLIWGGPIPGGPDAYVREWARSGELLGATDLPTTVAELRAAMTGFGREMKSDERVREAVVFLSKPPLPANWRFPYRILFAGAVASLPRDYRRLLGLRRPAWPAITVTRVFLWLVAQLTGPVSQSERFARQRLSRAR